MILNQGSARAEVIVLDDALSFWGGFDPQTGQIIDQHHPQRGITVSGKILVIPFSRGSAGTPAGVAESLRTGAGPVGIVLGEADVNIAIGAMIADTLYGTSTPVVVANASQQASIRNGDHVEITVKGEIRQASREA